MAIKLFPLANEQVQDIWLYTEEQWGESQATSYVNELFDFFEGLPHKQHLWRSVPHASLRGAFYAPYREHIVFFRHFTGDELGILAVLHHRQNVLNRLLDIDERIES